MAKYDKADIATLLVASLHLYIRVFLIRDSICTV